MKKLIFCIIMIWLSMSCKIERKQYKYKYKIEFGNMLGSGYYECDSYDKKSNKNQSIYKLYDKDKKLLYELVVSGNNYLIVTKN